MKIATSLLALLSLSGAACAAEPAWYGEANCRIAPVEPKPMGDFVKWSGACKDGYAEGTGVLEWDVWKGSARRLEAALERGAPSGEGRLTTRDGSYTGTLKNGMPHGAGYFRYANGDQYEGGVADGQRDGNGTMLQADRSRYEGQWKNGQREGAGRATFALGGAYEGEWKNDKPEGKGVMTFAGSGRKYEGQFKDGAVAAAAPQDVAKPGHYAMPGEVPTGSKLRENRAEGFLPLDSSWGELTVGQQNLVRSFYPALEPGDEPPYPVGGNRNIYKVVIKARDAFKDVKGSLRLYVLVGKDGKARTVTAIGAPHPEVTRYASLAVMAQQYKPAMCRGEPCEMIYPLEFNFVDYEPQII